MNYLAAYLIITYLRYCQWQRNLDWRLIREGEGITLLLFSSLFLFSLLLTFLPFYLFSLIPKNRVWVFTNLSVTVSTITECFYCGRQNVGLPVVSSNYFLYWFVHRPLTLSPMIPVLLAKKNIKIMNIVNKSIAFIRFHLFLSREIKKSLIRGIQRKHIMTTSKHLVYF